VCWLAPAGAEGFCVAADRLGRPAGGIERAWAPCVDDGECRSAQCLFGHCADTCCFDTSCVASAGSCRYSDPAPFYGADPGFYCGPEPQSGNGTYASCGSDGDCESGLCLEIPTVFVSADIRKRCTQPCCASTECQAVGDSASVTLVCTEVERDGGSVRACAPATVSNGGAEVGTVCTRDDECRSARCAKMGTAARCSDACCTDDNCGDSAFACRPSPHGLTCLLK
jgi:hypothetical protein